MFCGVGVGGHQRVTVAQGHHEVLIRACLCSLKHLPFKNHVIMFHLKSQYWIEFASLSDILTRVSVLSLRFCIFPCLIFILRWQKYNTLKVEFSILIPYTFCQIQQIASHGPLALFSVPAQKYSSLLKWETKIVAQTEP